MHLGSSRTRRLCSNVAFTPIGFPFQGPLLTTSRRTNKREHNIVRRGRSVALNPFVHSSFRAVRGGPYRYDTTGGATVSAWAAAATGRVFVDLSRSRRVPSSRPPAVRVGQTKREHKANQLLARVVEVTVSAVIRQSLGCSCSRQKCTKPTKSQNQQRAHVTGREETLTASQSL